MLRRVLLNKSPIRKLSSIYDKKYFNNFKKIDFDLVFWRYCLSGGIIGSGYSCYYLGFKKYNNTSSRSITIFMTTIAGLWGFATGFTLAVVSPFWMPFAAVGVIFRYLDPPKLGEP